MDKVSTRRENPILYILRKSRWVKMDYTYEKGIINFEMLQNSLIWNKSSRFQIGNIEKNLNDDT